MLYMSKNNKQSNKYIKIEIDLRHTNIMIIPKKPSQPTIYII